MIYRLDRCSPADVAAFTELAGILLAPLPEPLSPSLRFYSPVLRNNIMLSELWADPPPPASEMQEYLAEANVALGLTDDAWDGDPGAERRASTASPEHERAIARLREAIAAR